MILGFSLAKGPVGRLLFEHLIGSPLPLICINLITVENYPSTPQPRQIALPSFWGTVVVYWELISADGVHFSGGGFQRERSNKLCAIDTMGL